MDKILNRRIFALSILVVLSLYLFFFQSGKMALTDPDEAFYAETAKEMLSRGEWATPYIYGQPQFEKPILFYWLTESSFKIFGVNEFAARLPSGLFALIGVIAMYLLGKILFNQRVAFLAAIMLAANVEYVMLSRACVTDMVLSTFMLLGVLFFFYGYLRQKGYLYLLSGAAFALATLTKGPVAILLPAAAIVLYILLNKDYKFFRKIEIVFAAAVFLAIALPWFVLMYKLHGKEFMDAFFGFQNVTRFMQSEHKIGSQFYYNIPVVFLGFFPWSVFLPVGFWRMFKKCRGTAAAKDPEGRESSIFVLSWFFVIFIFFSISSTKLPTYIFPSFISLALITAVFWDDFLKAKGHGAIVGQMKFSYYLLVVVAFLGAVGASLFVKYDYPALLGGVIISAAFFLFGIALSFITYINKKYVMTFFFILYTVLIFLYPLNKYFVAEIERYETSKDIAIKLKSLMKPEERLGCESHYLAGLAFYTGKFPVNLDPHNTLVQFLESKERTWFVLKEKNHIQIYTLDTEPFCKKSSYMVYKIGKRAIITNEMPEDGKYMVKRERR